jgi:hypothetical protein
MLALVWMPKASGKMTKRSSSSVKHNHVEDALILTLKNSHINDACSQGCYYCQTKSPVFSFTKRSLAVAC